MGSRVGVRGPTPPAVDPSTMGPMLRATTRRHPPDQLIHAIRAALLSTIRTECPEVLENLRDAVFNPLIYSAMPREDIVALLKRRSPHPVDMHRGSPHRQVRAQIVRWARRWHINAPGIRDEAWRTLSWWVRWARDSRSAGRVFGWVPLVNTTPRHIPPPPHAETASPSRWRSPDLARLASRQADACVAGGPGQRRD